MKCVQRVQRVQRVQHVQHVQRIDVRPIFFVLHFMSPSGPSVFTKSVAVLALAQLQLLQLPLGWFYVVLCCFIPKNRTCFDLFQLNFLQRSVCRAIRAMGKRSLVGKMVQCRIFRNWYSSNHFNSPMSWGASDRTQSRQSKFAERKGPQDVTSIGIVQECRECFCGSSRDTKTLPKCLQY